MKRLFIQAGFVTTLVAAGTLFAGTAGDLKVPPNFQHWYLVNSLLITKDPNQFGIVSGLHLIYVNGAGFERLKRGGSTPYPDGTVLVDDVRAVSPTDGAYQQGARTFNTLMVKDSKKYASTGGWGFQAWAAVEPNKAIVNDPTKQCFTCHLPKQANDYTYSTYLH
jgi:hypothetical protein